MFEGAYDKKAKLSLPLLGWCIADPEETDHLDSKDVLKVSQETEETDHIEMCSR